MKQTLTLADCVQHDCYGDGIEEYFGYCPQCWVELTWRERAVLRGEDPPPEPLPPTKEIVHEHHTYKETVYPPPPSRLAKLALLSWRMFVTGYIVGDFVSKWKH